MGAWRRFERLLPLRFNDGLPVPDSVIGEVLLELENRFGAVTWETQTIRGLWHHAVNRFLGEHPAGSRRGTRP